VKDSDVGGYCCWNRKSEPFIIFLLPLLVFNMILQKDIPEEGKPVECHVEHQSLDPQRVVGCKYNGNA